MSLGHLTTTKNWGQLRQEVQHEFALWNINQYKFPFKDDVVRRGGEVTVEIISDGAVFPLTCSAFNDYRDGPERNLCAIREVVRSLRLADQRGIGLVMAQAAKSLLALPEPVEPGDPDYVLGVRKETPSAVKKAAYRELVKMYHPDTPVTGNRERYDRIRAAAEALGLAA